MKKQMYIPEIGNIIKLEEDWEFTLYIESRNFTLLSAITNEDWNYSNYREKGPITTTLPKGSKLTVDRIYIRQGLSNFSSLSFYLDAPEISKKRLRFWAKLVDVNNIIFSIVNAEEPLNLQCGFENIQNGDYIYTFGTKPHKENYTRPLLRIHSTGEQIEIFNVSLTYDIEERKSASGGLFGYSRIDYYYKNVSYELKTLEGELIQSFKTRSTMLKKAKDLYKEQQTANV